jgi:two-component system, cell cycle response regulator
LARILIIAADPVSAAHIADLLAAHGHAPLVPGSAASSHPDLALCVLPPGAQAGKMVSGLRTGATPRGVPLLALSALAGEGDSERLLGAGFDGYIALPIEPDSFVAEVEAFLPPQSVEAPTLLLVDDDAFMLAILADLLAPDGYRILTAQSGAEGLALMEAGPVHVIVSDQWMPGMSGTEFMVQAQARYPHTVRLILSAQSGSADIAAAIAAGAVDSFHAKPWTGSALRDGIRAAFARQRARAAG